MNTAVEPPAPSKTAYRDAMARMGAAVHVVTTDGPGGRVGFTATAVCSVTDTPPTLLVCLNHGASVYPAFQANQALCVNTLGANQQALADLFSSKTQMGERFAADAWTVG
ncbi:MAG TPA: flavin reductase, partial [Burkholderiaceae bacterium]